MDPQTPTVPTPPPQVTPPVVSPILPKKNNLVVILLSVLLLMAISAAALFFLQTQKLTKQLAQLQIRVQGTPIETIKVDCKDPRQTTCTSTLECMMHPPYICGSDSKSYCTVCEACSNKEVAWYEMKNSPCKKQ